MAKLTQNKSTILLLLIAVLSAFFFGLVSFALVSIVGKQYTYLLALPVALLIGLVFIFSRNFFLLVVLMARPSLDVVFEAIKIGSFGLGGILNGLMIIIAVLLYLENAHQLKSQAIEVKRAWLIFIILSFISLFYTPVFSMGLKTFLSYLSYAALFIIGLYSVKTEKDFEKWIKVIAISSLIPFLYGLKALAIGGGGLRDSIGEGLRLQSTFPHPNPFAPYMVLMITVCFYLYKSKILEAGSYVRKSLPVYILILIGMLVMTKTRSAWAACFLLFIAYGFLVERKFLIYVFIAPFLALLVPDIQDRLLDLTKNSDYGATGFGRLNSYAWRLKIWHDSIAWMTPAHYLGGYGLAAFVHHSMDFGMANAFQKATFEINAHNIVIQTFFNLGLLGLLSFIYLIYTPCRALFNLYIHNKLLAVTAFVVFVQFLMQGYSDNIWDYLIFEWYFWFFIGITLAYAGIVRDKKLVEQTSLTNDR